MNATRKIKYAYICEHCGHRNENFCQINAHTPNSSSERRGNTIVTTTYSSLSLRQTLIEKLYTPPLGKLSNKKEHKFTRAPYNFKHYNSKCSNCRKRQRWSTQYFYNIFFVFFAILILLFVLVQFRINQIGLQEYQRYLEGFEDMIRIHDTLTIFMAIILFLGGGSLLLILGSIFVGVGERPTIIEKLAGKRIKNECSIPEIIEVGEITFENTFF